MPEELKSMNIDLHYPSPRNRNLAPSTRFQGSKRKLLPWIQSTFEELDFSSAIDLMSGTGSVSYLLKRMGKRVIANDYLRFNYLTAQAFIENKRYVVGEEDLAWILGINSRVDYGRFVAKTFRNFYFTSAENRWIDRVICNINQLQGPSRPATRAKRAIATHSLIQACLMKRPFNLFHRRNLYLRRAKVDRTFGNQTTWETPFDKLLLRKVKESNSFVFDNGMNNKAMNEDATKISGSSTDLVYLDPPYFRLNGDRRQSNYRFAYHFVEGLAQYDVWPDLLDNGSSLRALKPNGNSGEILYQCQKSELRETLLDWLKRIVLNCPNAQVVMSYKEPGVPSCRAIKKLLEETGRDVSVLRAGYQYALNRRNGKPNENLELLFVAK